MVGAGAAPDTSPSLMGRLRAVPADQDAWRDFVGVYGVHILQWAKSWGLQDVDAEDVTQATLLRLAKSIRDFVYDPQLSFRGWLRTLAHRAWQDMTRVKKPLLLDGLDGMNPLANAEANDELAQALESAFDEELLRKAMASVRLRIEPQTWDAFRMTALESYSGSEAAERLGMRLTTVYKARSNVQKMLQEEIRMLEEECDGVSLPSR
jgi:RNA polymerase sigma factor (sigma-70 family)